jgi:hypothetical protein
LRVIRCYTNADTYCNCDAHPYTNCNAQCYAASNTYTKNSSNAEESTDTPAAPVASIDEKERHRSICFP